MKPVVGIVMGSDSDLKIMATIPHAPTVIPAFPRLLPEIITRTTAAISEITPKIIEKIPFCETFCSPKDKLLFFFIGTSFMI